MFRNLALRTTAILGFRISPFGKVTHVYNKQKDMMSENNNKKINETLS